METVCSSKVLVSTYESTQHQNPEEQQNSETHISKMSSCFRVYTAWLLQKFLTRNPLYDLHHKKLNSKSIRIMWQAYFNTWATVLGPNHCPTCFPSDAPISAIWWIEYAAARRSSNMCRIWRYALFLESGLQHQSRPISYKCATKIMHGIYLTDCLHTWSVP